MKPTKKISHLAALLIVLGLSACANQPYVVLLDNGDGTVSKVQVAGKKGVTLLDKHRQAAVIGGAAGETFVATDEQIKQDFGLAMAASPAKPISFLLYFEAGGTKLTPESEADIPKILAEIAKRAAADISVIGHTDTAGDDAANEALGLTRAQFVASLFSEAKLESDKLAVESHGEKNPLLPTPDNTAEPRNRRVEVTVR